MRVSKASSARQSIACGWIAIALMFVLGLLNGPCCENVRGQNAVVAPSTSAPSGSPQAVPAVPSGMDPKKMAELQAAAAAKAAAAKKGPPGDKKDEKKDGKKDEKKDDKKDESDKEVKRPTEPPEPPNPEELKVRPDKDNKVKVNFKGQPWPAVLEWLADISNMSFDWQEAPAGFLNFMSKRSYTIEEIRDVINQRLLVRGYTLLGHDEVMSLVNIKKLDPSMIPRVSQDKLAEFQPHEFVKVSFALDHLIAESMVEELKPMLSPNGKLTAMQATNRIEAVDAVVNLREIHTLLQREQTSDDKSLPPKLFPLRYRRASEVVPQLQTLLGLESKKPAVPVSPQQQQAMQQAMMQAQQQAAKGKKPPTTKSEPEIHLLADDRNNCILVQAPPDKMAIITRAIKAIDVPLDRDSTLQATVGRMKIYRLSTMNPEPLVKTLQSIGNLDLDTKLEIDNDKKSIIAYATLADHVTIQALIEKLDGSGREFHVIRLRRLEADYVAGTITHMMFGGEEEPKKDNRSRYYGFFGRSSSDSAKKERPDGFRVDADVEYNRLLLWANKVELEEVNKFLVKLGEIPPEGGNPETVRVLDVYGDEETAVLIERLRRAWAGKNKLLIDAPATKQKKTEDKESEDKNPKAQEAAPKNTSEKSVQRIQHLDIFLTQLQQDSTDAKQPVEKPTVKTQTHIAPPIQITRDESGRVVIASKDTAALDTLEQLIAELAPPPKDYHIFRLKHAWAYDVVFILESFFKEEGEEQESEWDPWYWGYRPSQKTKTPTRLSKRRPLRFILDSESNSILVQGAGAEQLKQIQDLVEFYDKLDPPDSQNIRQTEVFTIRYSKASVIAEAIKEVYRDLLSSTDKAFSSNKKEQNRPESRYTYIIGSNGSDDEMTKAPKFKGLLSIGVDDVSNTLIVSAPTYLFNKVSEMIQTLDRAAWPVANVRVVRIGDSVDHKQLEKLLMAVTDGTYKKPQPAETKEPQQKK